MKKRQYFSFVLFAICFLFIGAGNSFLINGSASSEIDVYPGDDLQNILYTAAANSTIILHEGSYSGPHVGNPPDYEEVDNALTKIHDYDMSLFILKPLTIIGEGDVEIVNYPISIFSPDVTIENISIKENYSTLGGGISILGVSNVMIRDCTINNNDSNKGGGIYIGSSYDITISNCNISRNSAYHLKQRIYNPFVNGLWHFIYEGEGGAIYAEYSNKITVTNCSFTSNDAYHAGGAITVNDCNNFEIINSTLTNSEAGHLGGGIYLYKATNALLWGTTISESSCLPSDDEKSDKYFGYGAGAFLSESDVEIQYSNFENNESYFGGGIFSNLSDVVMSGTTFNRNEAVYLDQDWTDSLGGLVEIALSIGKLDFKDVINKVVQLAVAKINAPHDVLFPWDGHKSFGGLAGGVYSIDSTIEISECDFLVNKAAKSGGGIYLISSEGETYQPKIGRTLFQGNQSESGAAITNMEPGTRINNCVFNNNKATAIGGAVNSISHIVVRNSQFTNNSAVLGGAAYHAFFDNVQSYINCTFDGNHVADENGNGEGGAIYAMAPNGDQNKLEITECTFSSNEGQRGGAIASKAITIVLTDSLFNQNTAYSRGGALYAIDSTIKSTNNEMSQNVSQVAGSAIYSESGSLDINRDQYLRNEILRKGTIHQVNGVFQASNSLFAYNESTEILGSALYVDGVGVASFTNCTITANQNNPIYAVDRNSILTIVNSIVTANGGNNGASNEDILVAPGGSYTVQYSVCDTDSISGVGNYRTGKRIFVDYDQGDFRLSSDLTGDDLQVLDGGLNNYREGNLDLAGNKRLLDYDNDNNATVDMGCYENQTLTISFYEVHPLDGIAHVTLTGPTVFEVDYNADADISALGIIPDENYVFLGWQTFDRRGIEDFNHIQEHMKYYARVHEGAVTISYYYNPNKIAILNEGTDTIIDADTHRFDRIVIKGSYINPPLIKTLNGWDLAEWDNEIDHATKDASTTAIYRPLATYNMSGKGQYKTPEGDRVSVYRTPEVDPLFQPDPSDIKEYGNYDFLGWSLSRDGTIIELPSSLSEPETYYAIYTLPHNTLTMRSGIEGSFIINPSGDYLTGTCFDLTDRNFAAFMPDPYYYHIGYNLEYRDNSGVLRFNRVNCEDFILLSDLTLRALYERVASDKAIVIDPGMDGVVNHEAAIQMGFVADGDSGQYIKNAAAVNNHERLLELITTTTSGMRFYGFTKSSTEDSVIFTAQYQLFQLYKIQDILNLGNQLLIIPIGEADAAFDLTDETPPPPTGSVFAGWENAEGTSPIVVPVDGDRAVTAVFKPVECDLTVNIVGEGTADLPSTVEYGTLLPLPDTAASATAGYRFVGFRDENGVEIQAIDIVGDTTITAVFEAIAYDFDVLAGPNGFISSSLKRTYHYGDSVDLAEIKIDPDDNYLFTYYESTDGNHYGVMDHITITGDLALTAVFAKQQYQLSIEATGGGSVDPGLADTYDEGTVVTLSIDQGIPNYGKQFLGFFDDQGERISEVAMNSDITISARFADADDQYLLAVIAPYSESMATNEMYQYHDAGAVVQMNSLTISPLPGYQLLGWQDTSGNSITSIVMNSNQVVVAQIEPIDNPAYYHLTVQVAGQGVESVSGDYLQGTIIQLHPSLVTAAEGYAFTNFTDEAGEVITQVQLSAPRLLTAHCPIIQYHLTVTAGSNGSITNTLSTEYGYGALVDLDEISVTSDYGYQFSHWETVAGEQLTSNELTIVDDTEIIAVFSVLTQYDLSFSTHSQVDYNLNGTSEAFFEGTEVNLADYQVVPEAGYQYVGWEDASNSPITAVTMDSAQIVYAIFASDEVPVISFSVTAEAEANGSISSGADQTVVSGNNSASIMATPDEHYHFVEWNDSNTDNPRIFVNVTEDKTITATFAVDTYTIAASAADHGRISSGGSQEINYGADSEEILAEADEFYHFVRWDDGNLSNPRVYQNVSADQTIKALFAIDTYEVTAYGGDHGCIESGGNQIVAHDSASDPILAVADDGYCFKSWDDDNVSNPRVLTSVTDSITLTALWNGRPILQQGVEAEVAVDLELGDMFSIDLATIFTDPDHFELNYEIAINEGDFELLEDSLYSWQPQDEIVQQLRFRAFDGLNYSEESHLVTIHCEDTIPPQIITDLVSQNVLTDRLRCSIVALDDNDESPTISVDNGWQKVYVQADGRYVIELELGRNEITVTATDCYGNQSVLEVNVNNRSGFTSPIPPIVQPPVIIPEPSPDPPIVGRVVGLRIGSSEVWVDGLADVLDVLPFIDSTTSRTMVPLRFVAEVLGAEVEWLADNRQVRITHGDNVILLTIDSFEVIVNGESEVIDCMPRIVGDRTFVPLRFITETFGAEVNYDDETKEIRITDLG